MNKKIELKTLEFNIPSGRVDGKMLGEDRHRWIELKELLKLRYFIVYGDNGGDDFVKIAKDEESFNELLQEIPSGGNISFDFLTEVRIVVKNGEEYKPKISVS